MVFRRLFLCLSSVFSVVNSLLSREFQNFRGILFRGMWFDRILSATVN